MPLLALDANAALHAKQLAGAGFDPLTLVDTLVRSGTRLLLTSAVEGEQVAMSLSGAHARWREMGAVRTENTTSRERREVKNQLGRDMKIPGDNDVALIALAAREGAVLLSHDDAAVVLARRCDVLAVDFLDLADHCVAVGDTAWAEVEQGFSKLATYAWRPSDWAGTVEGTVQLRVHRARTLARLETALVAKKTPIQDVSGKSKL